MQGFYYMRLHGRNAEKWWRHEKSEDRYDYLYSADELKEFSETADAARQLVKKLYLYTNNHFSAKSVANAAMIKQQLGEPLTREARRPSPSGIGRCEWDRACPEPGRGPVPEAGSRARGAFRVPRRSRDGEAE